MLSAGKGKDGVETTSHPEARLMLELAVAQSHFLQWTSKAACVIMRARAAAPNKVFIWLLLKTAVGAGHQRFFIQHNRKLRAPAHLTVLVKRSFGQRPSR